MTTLRHLGQPSATLAKHKLVQDSEFTFTLSLVSHEIPLTLLFDHENSK